MKTFGFFLALLTASSLLAQSRSGGHAGSFGVGRAGSVNRGSAPIGRFNSGWNGGYGGYRSGGVVIAPYAYPVYGYGYGSGSGYGAPLFCGNDPFCYDSEYYAGQGASYGAAAPPVGYGQPQQQQPSTVVVMAPPSPVYGAAPGQPAMLPPPGQSVPQGGPQPASAEGETATHYFIAFKDHSIYTAVAYWVDGDTLHYFTSGSTHNQVSVSLVDRDLTKRLNEASGLEVKLPAAK